MSGCEACTHGLHDPETCEEGAEEITWPRVVVPFYGLNREFRRSKWGKQVLRELERKQKLEEVKDATDSEGPAEG